MRQVAWLNTAPTPGKATPTSAPRKTRMQKLQADGTSPAMPPLWRGEHLLDYLWDVGPVMGSGMGAAALTYGELHAWQANTGIALQPWEAQLLRHLSREYAAEAAQATAPDRAAPWTDAPTELDRAAISRRLGQQLKALVLAQKSKGAS